jgi:hypothetical protein
MKRVMTTDLIDDSRFVTFKGRTKQLMQWTKELGLNFSMVRRRLDNGWAIEKALTKPSQIIKTN